MRMQLAFFFPAVRAIIAILPTSCPIKGLRLIDNK